MIYFKKIIAYLFPWVYRKERTKTVRYAFPVFLIIGASLTATAIFGQKDAYVVVEVVDSEVREGDNFQVDVFVVAETPVNAVEILLELPTDEIKFLGVDTGRSVITLWTEQPYIEGSVVHLSGGTYRKGFVGKHRIATVNAQALKTGIYSISSTDISLYAGDGTGDEVPISSNDEDGAQVVVASKDGSYVPTADPNSIGGKVTVNIVGDIDNDGQVTLTDISRFMVAWNQKTSVYDFSGDGQMTFRDFGIILARFFLN